MHTHTDRTFINTYIHIIHTYIHTHTYKSYIHIHTFIQTYSTCTYIYTNAHIHIYKTKHSQVHAFVCRHNTHVLLCIACTCIHTHTATFGLPPMLLINNAAGTTRPPPSSSPTHQCALSVSTPPSPRAREPSMPSSKRTCTATSPWLPRLRGSCCSPFSSQRCSGFWAALPWRVTSNLRAILPAISLRRASAGAWLWSSRSRAWATATPSGACECAASRRDCVRAREHVYAEMCRATCTFACVLVCLFVLPGRGAAVDSLTLDQHVIPALMTKHARRFALSLEHMACLPFKLCAGETCVHVGMQVITLGSPSMPE
jgi:hypothetical protein